MTQAKRVRTRRQLRPAAAVIVNATDEIAQMNAVLRGVVGRAD